jgi:outer membrane protein OmpA-like peptidoglycan-associated protein
MTNDFRRHWQVALATLLIWCSAGLLGPIVQAADDNPAQVSVDDHPAQMSGAGSQALKERLDALVEQAAVRMGEEDTQAGAPGVEALALREQLQAAETQIALLKNVVIQSLRAQSAAEEALRREQATQRTTPAPTLARATVGSPELMLADQLEALTDTVQRLRSEVDALRGQSPSGQSPSGQTAERHAGSVVQQSSSVGLTKEALAATAENEDALLANAGMGGQYEPLIDDEPSGSGPSAAAAVASGDPIKVAEVHFNSGSARLTPGGERNTREAVERIRSMGAAKVRVVAFADTVGDSASNLMLSKERALSIAAMLESVGLRRDLVEVVGSGEQGIPEPTADDVPEPLNRCAGIFVIPSSTG